MAHPDIAAMSGWVLNWKGGMYSFVMVQMKFHALFVMAHMKFHALFVMVQIEDHAFVSGGGGQHLAVPGSTP